MKVVIVQHGLYPAPRAVAEQLSRLGVDVELVTVGARRTTSSPFREHAVFGSSALARYTALRPLVKSADIIHYFPGRGLEFLPFLNRRATTIFNLISVSVVGVRAKDWLINQAKRVQPLFADYIIYSDEPLARTLRPLLPGVRSSLLPVGYSDDLFYQCPVPPARPVRRLLYHGAIDGPRHLETLVYALARLPSDYRLTLIGGRAGHDEHRERLWRAAQGAGCAERLELLHVPQPGIRQHICDADLCLGFVPSLHCYQDQFVMKNAEYLACQRPVLTTATRFTRSFSKEMGPDAVLLSDGTVDDLVEKVLAAETYVRRFYAPQNLARVSAVLRAYSVREVVTTQLLPLYNSLTA